MDRLKAMQAFGQVVDSGSFSAAARRLNVGQPALSKSIAQLEDRLGVKLLVRTTHGLVPTEAGLNFYERARRSIEEADEAGLAARGAGSGLVAGKLCVSAAVTFARIHLMQSFANCLRRRRRRAACPSTRRCSLRAARRCGRRAAKAARCSASGAPWRAERRQLASTLRSSSTGIAAKRQKSASTRSRNSR
jgi:DNA-binding transcriptional LysR family regulator